MDNIHGTMVYSFEKPMWHAITEPSKEKHTAVEVINKRFGGGFSVSRRPVTVMLNGKQTETKYFGIVRSPSPADPKEIVFDICTERYNPLQPYQVAEIFDANVCEPVETMAFLGDGNDMFISWVMPMAEIRTGDEVQMYGIVRTGFTTKNATRLFIATVRPVCWNTVTLAEGWAKKHTDKDNNKGMIWKGRGVNRELARDLGYWMTHVQSKALAEVDLVQSFFGRLAQKPIKSDKEALGILSDAFPKKGDHSGAVPWQLRDETREKIEVYNEGQQSLRDGIFQLFSGAGTAITPDCWGMLNATSEYFCHVQPSKKPIANSVMFGPRSQNIMSMVETLQKFSK